uniref:Importin N-terminal domain-containing protein n=1 Tax=Chenopodium quinoa TaxID=63459 RepID=A0A803KVA8_CHEQI
MANAINLDQDQQWLINCLNATLDTDHQVRSFAEASLTQASLQHVLLKQFIKKHWHEDEDNFEHPIVASDEKEVICRLLLLCLDDTHRKICTAVSMAVASIAHYDWPEDWPELLPFLMKLINDQTNMNGVLGALRCLALLSGDIDDKAVPSLVPILFPCLLSIVSSPQIYEKSMRAKSLSIVYSCTSMLGTMSGAYKAETSHLMSPMLQPWMEQFSAVLSHPVQPEDPDDWSIRIEVLKCLNQFVQNFPSATEKEFMSIVGPLWQTFVSTLKVYEQSSVEGTQDSFEGRYDSDGAERSLESFVIQVRVLCHTGKVTNTNVLQLFEFLLTIVGSSRFVKVVANNLQELVYYTFGFMQITEQQMNAWSLDANQYISDEDDNMYNCRVSGVLLLEEIISSCGEDGLCALIDAARRRFIESQQQKADGFEFWWRIREAVIYAMASLSDQLQEAEVCGSDGFDLKKFIEQMIMEDIGAGVHECPFLYARVFSSVPKFSSMLSLGVIEHFLFASLRAIGMDVPPPVKVGSCRVLSQLLSEANKEALQPQILQLFSSLVDLLNHASEESLHLVLETLQAAIKSGHEASLSVEPIISPIILNTWVSHVSDPFISIDAIEVLEAIKSAPGCIEPLVSRVLPYIGPILSQPKQQPDGLVAGSLDLVTMLLKNAPGPVIKALYDVCFNPIIQIVLQSDDHSEMQNATECLAAFVCGGKSELLAWGGDPGFTMRSLLDALSRLLDPDLESSGSFFVGNYILQLILNLPSQMGQHIQDLVSALVRRMQSCEIAGLKNSLLLVFARLVHLSAPNVGQFIDLLVSIPGDGDRNSFAYVMSEWVKHQGEIQGSYQIKVTTTSLALLLSTRHVELAKNFVQGHLIQSTAGITTRSKAKSAPEQWTVMPLNAKILALLADTLIEIQEQVTEHDEEDSDWEEVDAGDADVDQNILHVATAKSSGKPAYEHLAAMAKVFENEQDGDEDDLLSSIDPLNEINVANYLVDFLVKFYQSDTTLFDQLSQSLTQSQRHAIQMILNHYQGNTA